MTTHKRTRRNSRTESDFYQKVSELDALQKRAAQDSDIQKIMQMREAGLLPRPSFNLEYGPSVRITQLTNLK